MNINRYNYEEYFLLYIDNELGEAERRAVERFVEENPDLKNELQGLQQVTFIADKNIHYPDKNTLLTEADALEMDHTNCTGFFILYADNELNNKQKAQVEQFVYRYPEHQADFELMLHVKMEPDRSIIFEGKEALLHEQETARVVPFWWKLSAGLAAAAILFLFAFLELRNDADKGSDLISQNTRPANTDSGTTIPRDLSASDSIAKKPDSAPKEEGQPEEKQEIKKAEPALPSKQNIQPENTVAKVEKAPEAPVNPTPVLDPVEPKESLLAELPRQHIETADLAPGNISSKHQGDVHLAAYSADAEVDESAEQEDADVRIAGFAVKPESKLRGIINKTSKFLHKTSNKISSAPGLVVGRFEIAVR